MNNVAAFDVRNIGWGGSPEKDLPETEFHRIPTDLPKDLGPIRDKYPLTFLVATLAMAIFGFLTFCSFSITHMVSGLLMMSMATAMGMSIGKKGLSIWSHAARSVMDIYHYSMAKVEAQAQQEGQEEA